MRRCPHLFEINARLLVERVSRRRGRRATLLDVPNSYWGDLSSRGFDLVWLMGVWRRSKGSRRVALADPRLCAAYGQALPDWTEHDVAGSPYAVSAYELDPALGDPDDLARIRRRLNRIGMGLILDFVPNHLALDHPWTRVAPNRFVGIDEPPDERRRGHYFPVGSRWIAHGRDPYFPPWRDTAQIDVLDPDARAAMIEQLTTVAEVADGARCDMAMLVLDEIFRRTWSLESASRPASSPEFWTEAIDAVRTRDPGFVLIAEAYWGLEWRLHELGFDAFYDKTLYDRLRSGSPHEVMAHLRGTSRWHDCAVRFVENHDEPRAVRAFGPRALVAAAVVMTVPGVRLVHDGQPDGRRERLPVQLVREPDETTEVPIRAAYDRLVGVCNEPVFHEGQWSSLEPRPLGGEHAPLAWSWRLDDVRRVVVINLTAAPTAGVVPIEAGQATDDALGGLIGGPARIERVDDGMRVELAPYAACVV